jgi:methylated-DNA-[protein]-cysteine S-methyltransferase
MKNTTFKYIKVKTPFGMWQLVAQDDAVVAFGADLPVNTWRAELDRNSAVLNMAGEQLKEYFAGTRREFSFKFAFPWGTDFQKSVWKTLLKIPYGKTWSYRTQAERLKKDKAFRAVGSANGKNPLCIIVPCHRVIATDGTLGGYSGGLNVKKSLLAIEAQQK